MNTAVCMTLVAGPFLNEVTAWSFPSWAYASTKPSRGWTIVQLIVPWKRARDPLGSLQRDPRGGTPHLQSSVSLALMRATSYGEFRVSGEGLQEGETDCSSFQAIKNWERRTPGSSPLLSSVLPGYSAPTPGPRQLRESIFPSVLTVPRSPSLKQFRIVPHRAKIYSWMAPSKSSRTVPKHLGHFVNKSQHSAHLENR